MNILMVAAENDALPGGKVGGIGDVVRDIPDALAQAGQQVMVVTPGYGTLSKLAGSNLVGDVQAMFRGGQHRVDIYQVPAKHPHPGVTQFVLEHPLFAAGGEGKIYCDDDASRPFATDASKFALFNSAVAAAITTNQFSRVDVLHLHDWHAAMLAVLRAFDPEYKALKSILTVYTIHNLALQGVRPFEGDESSMRGWYPGLHFDSTGIKDPRAQNCINLMRAGINLSDKVHVVSPAYAAEIVLPSNHEQGYFGGEGLEDDLQQAARQERLHGILNGCDYDDQTGAVISFGELLRCAENEVLKLMGQQVTAVSAHVIACRRIEQCLRFWEGSSKTRKAPVLVTSVGRITDQKILLLRQLMADGRSALDHLLDKLGEQGVFILLGSGTPELENFLTGVAARRANFIYLQGYAESLSQHLYNSGDLFLMPSSFEPCGISQMLAMRAGQPCLVHSVGGLRDTVKDGENGFSFAGDGLAGQAQNMIARFESALKIKRTKRTAWQAIAAAAAQARFLWSDAAGDYLRLLYRG